MPARAGHAACAARIRIVLNRRAGKPRLGIERSKINSTSCSRGPRKPRNVRRRSVPAAPLGFATEPRRKRSMAERAQDVGTEPRTDFSLLIGGKLVGGSGRLDVINPATGTVLAHAPAAGRAELDEAVAAAREAF